MHKITDMYGPIPYTGFGEDDDNPYDPQETVYTTFLEELEAAVDELYTFVQLYPGVRPLRNYDAVYQGDYEKWIAFANSLRLRLAMRIRFADPAKARIHAEAAVAHPIGVMTSNTQNAFYPVLQRNPLNEVWADYNDSRMGATISCYLNGYSDPRASAYFTPSSYYNPPEYRGVRNGINITSTSRTRYNDRAATPNVAFDDPLQWMVAAESYFLRAEGAALDTPWNMGGTAEDLYNEGIKVSFEKSGITSATVYDNYIADDASTPANFTDPYSTGNSYTYPAGTNTVTIKWDDTLTEEQKLEKIVTQKYLAMFPDGQEAWSEFRRTGYPRVIPNVLNRVPTQIDTNIQIRRLMFPSTEYDTNNSEVQKAVQMIGGEDHGGIKLWWDQK